jgi:hypothetical protein
MIMVNQTNPAGGTWLGLQPSSPMIECWPRKTLWQGTPSRGAILTRAFAYYLWKHRDQAE